MFESATDRIPKFDRRVGLGSILVAGLACALVTTASHADESDAQQWSTLRIHHPISERWAVSFLGQGRFSDEISNPDALLVRPAIEWNVGNDVFLGVGYDHFRRFQAPDENRAWQEVAFAVRFGTLVSGNRLRLEERWIDGLDGVVARGRYRLRCAHPIGSSPAYAVVANEVFWNFNDLAGSPENGFEQNRLAGGIGLHVGSRLRAELGYQWRLLNRRSAERRSDHILTLSLFFDTRGKPKAVPTLEEGHH